MSSLYLFMSYFGSRNGMRKVYVSVINPTPMKPFYAQGDDRTFTRARPYSDESLAQRVLQQLEVYTTRP